MGAQDAKDLAPLAIRPRRANSRKGENGIVLVVGGSKIYHGAPTISALSALRSGVDLVYVAVPETVANPVRSVSPNLIVFPLPDSKLTPGCANKLLKWLPKVDAAVIGPGAGKQRPEGMVRLVGELLSQGVNVVLDADALNPDVVKAASGHHSVITPHAGEFRRVFGLELGNSLDERLEVVASKASEAKLTVVLKGRIDIISDGSRSALNYTGTPAMTVGGTGDALAGLIAGLIAKGAEPFLAGAAGVYFNGLAGERATERLGLHIAPTDLIEEIPSVLKSFDRIEE